MGPIILLSQGLGLAQMLGFTLESTAAQRGVIGITAFGQLIITLFGSGKDGTAKTIEAIQAAEKRIIAALDRLDKEVEKDIKEAFQTKEIANIAAANTNFVAKVKGYLESEWEDSDEADDEYQKAWQLDYATWTPTLVQSWEWAALNMGKDYAMLGVYLTAGNLYLNYCKLGIAMDYHIKLRKYNRRRREAEKQGKAPPKNARPDYSKLILSDYYNDLTSMLDQLLIKAQPWSDAIADSYAHITNAALSVGKDSSMATASQRWDIVDKAVKQYAIPHFDYNNAPSIAKAMQHMTTAKTDWDKEHLKNAPGTELS